MPDRALRVHVLALHQCAPIVPIGMLDLLRKSIELAATLPVSRPRRAIELSLIAGGTKRDVVCSNGLVVRADRTLADAGPADLVVVPALDPDIVTRLAQNAAVVAWLRRMFARGADVASACTGAFLLGEAGLLDGRTATTHWAFQSLLQMRYPKVVLAPQAVLADQGRVITAGGATSFINLALVLVERLLGPDVAWAASKFFLIDPNKSPQGAYAAFSTQKDHGDTAILRAQELVERDVQHAPSVDELAHMVALSPRTFSRRFLEATGNTARDYIQRVRIEAAKRALERGDAVASVAYRVGYGDAAAFRKLFSRLAGLTPADYRARYGPKAAPAWAITGTARNAKTMSLARRAPRRAHRS
ncbi:MAG: GlxA family transcriptional regulator [Kofleriaceae bacterium]